ncbi:MAG: DUF523 and DUF1722 domain-containing protein [Planctomycetes bacterium]|nr:DUF523 and DUF1722 domain-containing protein [Planctomycetota bacterium]
MTKTNARPIILASKCLGFEACRWNGDIIDDPFVSMLQSHADFITVCPECEIGLGVPRRPIRIVNGGKDGEPLLIQPATGTDVTSRMKQFCKSYVRDLEDFDGILLKFKSPSCGINNVNIYHRPDEGSVDRRGRGFFAEALLSAFPEIPAEDEGRLHNYQIREHWLTAIFTLARFRQICSSNKIGDLVKFQANHKYLLMSLSQTVMRELGRLVANHTEHKPEEVFAKYRTKLCAAFAQPPRETSRINVLQHIMGHFSKKLEKGERDYFLDIVEEYRRDGMPLSVPVNILRLWAIRYGEEYIAGQFFLNPYPKELELITDSGKGRKL